MQYNNIKKGIFLERPNRFIAHCLVNGEEVIAHVKNTGRCKELLVRGTNVYLEYVNNPNRRTICDLIAVEKGNRLVNIDSQAPNQVFYEALKQGKIDIPLQPGPLSLIRREKVYYDSRLDLYIEAEQQSWQAFIEIKGVTLEKDGVVLFPDAPTIRGVKHLHELIRAKQEGFAAYVVFVIQMSEVEYFMPNEVRHPEFAQALRDSEAAGVKILAYDCSVTPDSLVLGEPVEVRLK